MAVTRIRQSSIRNKIEKFDYFNNSISRIPLNLTVRGAGGGGGYAGSGTSGAGGLSTGIYNAALSDSLFLVVGQGGASIAPNGGTGTRPTGGGGLAGTAGYGGQGGGYSGVFLNSASQANALLIAGGGGGASYESTNGGAGGGPSGISGGQGAEAGGTGGSQSAGGVGVSGTVNGSALQGGDCNTSGDAGGGGGGGGGYWGGGAGSGANPGAAGGGGSGFVSSNIILPVTIQGSGGASATGTSSGGNGSIVISISKVLGVFLTVGSGLTYSLSESASSLTYTFTAGSGTITFGTAASSPRSYSNLLFWLDASDSSTVTITSGKVSQWNDKSGTGVNVVQANDAKRPTYVSNVQNGLPAVRFNGSVSSSLLSAGTSSLSPMNSKWDIFIAAKSSIPSAILAGFGVDAGGASGGLAVVALQASGFEEASAGSNVGRVTGTVNRTNNNIILRYSFDVADGIHTLMNSYGIIGTATNASARSNTPGQAQIGNLSDGAYFLSGDIYEICVYSRRLTMAEGNSVIAYLKTKWNI